MKARHKTLIIEAHESKEDKIIKKYVYKKGYIVDEIEKTNGEYKRYTLSKEEVFF